MESFYTGDVLGVEARLLPANTYNVMRTVFHQCGRSCVFVPVRSMQYQAVIDEYGVVFVYIHRRSMVEFAWRNFKPQQRESLEDPVPYEFVYYDEQAQESMQRMQGEFHKYIHQYNNREHERRSHSKQVHSKVVSFRHPADEGGS